MPFNSLDAAQRGWGRGRGSDITLWRCRGSVRIRPEFECSVHESAVVKTDPRGSELEGGDLLQREVPKNGEEKKMFVPVWSNQRRQCSGLRAVR